MKYKFRLIEANAKEAEISPENVEGITLLSIDEVKRLPEEVRKYFSWWWLRSPGDYSYRVLIVYRDGSIGNDNNGFGNVDCKAYSVRPALILNHNPSNFNNGDIIKVFDRRWYYQDGLALLMDEPLTDMAFRKNWSAKDANNYEKSDIKRYLDNWLKSALNGNYNYAIAANTSDNKDYKDFMARYKDINDDLSREGGRRYSWKKYCKLVVDPEDLEAHPDWVDDAYEDYVNLIES